MSLGKSPVVAAGNETGRQLHLVRGMVHTGVGISVLVFMYTKFSS